ncbi:MAG: hypothetical protein Q7K43_02535 [Candidatus Woesearchaeota archaeon]|nr:hypothetical protein [Candidatus Woesearchaeota archaeon]
MISRRRFLEIGAILTGAVGLETLVGCSVVNENLAQLARPLSKELIKIEPYSLPDFINPCATKTQKIEGRIQLWDEWILDLIEQNDIAQTKKISIFVSENPICTGIKDMEFASGIADSYNGRIVLFDPEAVHHEIAHVIWSGLEDRHGKRIEGTYAGNSFADWKSVIQERKQNPSFVSRIEQFAEQQQLHRRYTAIEEICFQFQNDLNVSTWDGSGRSDYHALLNSSELHAEIKKVREFCITAKEDTLDYYSELSNYLTLAQSLPERAVLLKKDALLFLNKVNVSKELPKAEWITLAEKYLVADYEKSLKEYYFRDTEIFARLVHALLTCNTMDIKVNSYPLFDNEIKLFVAAKYWKPDGLRAGSINPRFRELPMFCKPLLRYKTKKQFPSAPDLIQYATKLVFSDRTIDLPANNWKASVQLSQYSAESLK